MKRCPACNRSETDDTLAFCRVDGVALLSNSSSLESGAGTVRLNAGTSANEIETSLLPHKTDEAMPRVTGPTSTPLDRHSKGTSRELPKPNRRKTLIIVTAAIALVAIAAIGYFVAGSFIGGSGEKRIESVAVLPFENKSGNADSEYLSDGLAESLIYRLSQVSNLKVSPRSSVFRYKGQAIDTEKIGGELGVDAVMSGRVTQRGDDLMISVDLIDVRNKKTLWGEQFQRKMSDLLTTQSEIAAAIADKLKLRLSGIESTGVTKQYTSDNEAYQLYLQGRYFWNKRSSGNLRKATELLTAATKKDPNFALAYAGLADCYAVAYYYVGERPRELMPLAKTYAMKAIELDPTLAEPHATLGFANWLLDWDRETADKEFRRAIELNPNYSTAHHWYSRYLRGVGRMDDAWREIKRAEELDPLSLVIINNVAEMMIDRGELNSATRECQRTIDLDPNFWPPHQTLGIVLVKQGRYVEALSEAQRSVQLSNRGNASLALLAHVYGKLGQRKEAEAVIEELRKRYEDKQADARDLTVAYVGLDDRDQAFAWLEKAYQDHSVFLVFLKLEPLLEPLHSDRRWQDLERRVGITV